MIEVEHLSKTYGTTPAIEDITFSVEPGEILGFLGPNGAGKTTTMRILTGYLPADSGVARVAGREVHEDSMAVRRQIGYLPETPPLYPDMTVEGFLHFVARIKGVSAGDRINRVESSLQSCNLVDRRKTQIHKLSKGYRQRVGIAQAIVHDPPVIILDEPTVGLDPRQIIEVRNLIKGLRGLHTVILSTHILPEVSMTCTKVAIINQGKVVAIDTPEQLMTQLTGGGLSYELEVEGSLDTAQRVVEQVPGVATVEVVRPQGLPSDRGRLRIRAEAGADPGRDLAAVVVNANVGLWEMRRTHVSLEDVFLQLTTQETVDADANAESRETDPIEISELGKETTDV
jgi:ABC-2 type transport system ATP-binding protein